MVSSNRCNENYNTFDNLCSSFCVPNNAKDVNVKVFSMITKINGSRSLKKHVSWVCKCRLDSKRCNLKQGWNKDEHWCECKNRKKTTTTKNSWGNINVKTIMSRIILYWRLACQFDKKK